MSGQLHALATLIPKNNPGVYSIGSFLSPKTGLDFLEERKVSYPCLFLLHYLVLYLYLNLSCVFVFTVVHFRFFFVVTCNT